MANVAHGIEGTVTFASGYDTDVHQWSITLTGDTGEITAFSDTWRSHMGGLKSWSGSYTARWDAEEDIDGPSAAGLAGASAAATFVFADDTTDGSIAGNIIITGIDTSVDIEAANSLTFTFIGDGEPTITESTTT